MKTWTIWTTNNWWFNRYLKYNWSCLFISFTCLNDKLNFLFNDTSVIFIELFIDERVNIEQQQANVMENQLRFKDYYGFKIE